MSNPGMFHTLDQTCSDSFFDGSPLTPAGLLVIFAEDDLQRTPEVFQLSFIVFLLISVGFLVIWLEDKVLKNTINVISLFPMVFR